MSVQKKLYSLGEEIFNAVSHGAGALLSVAGLVVLVVVAAINGNAWSVVSSAIYGSSLVILYTMSTLYHSITNPTAKKVFRIFDHSTIFLLISGTYTPITLVGIRAIDKPLAWTIFGILWGLTAIGIVFNSINLEKYKRFSLICYIIMGWLVVLAVKPLIIDPIKQGSDFPFPVPGMIFLLIGGIFYTVGIIFYKMKSHKYMHSIWHLFTIAGSVFHYFAILFWVIK